MAEEITIIIPAYNVGDYITKTLTSVWEQTFEDYKVIVVNDGSTDNTGDICDDFAKKDPRFKVIHKKNEGVSKARNIGIEQAKGKYLLFWDGDDFAKKNALEKLYRCIQEKQSDSVIYGYFRYQEGKVIETVPPIFEEGLYEEHSISEELVPRFIGLSEKSINHWIEKIPQALYVENPALWRILLTREVVMTFNIRFDERLKVGEDTIFISEYLCHARSCYVMSDCLYYLLIRDTSTISEYERNPLAKLSGKLNLLEGRRDLVKRIMYTEGQDIQKLHQGTISLSSLELALLLSKRHKEFNFRSRYNSYQQYANHEEVIEAIQSLHINKKWKLKAIPIHLLKLKANFLLFIGGAILNSIHFDFTRN